MKMLSSIGAVSQSQTNILIGNNTNNGEQESKGEMSLIEKVERTIQQKKILAQ